MQEGTKFNYTFEYNKRDLKYLMNSLYLCYLKIISEINSVSHRENDIRDIFISDQYLNLTKKLLPQKEGLILGYLICLKN